MPRYLVTVCSKLKYIRFMFDLITELKFLPILVLTTEAEESMIEKGRAAGISGWLLKPFQPEQLLWAVKKVVWSK